MVNLHPISRVLGVMLMVLGIFMWTSLPFSLYFQSGDIMPIFYSGLITIGSGGLLWLYKFRQETSVSKREAYIIVAMGWFVISVFSTLPYLLSGTCTHFADAFFEAASGLTSTGSSILTDVESTPAGILYWRSLTQWIGGMGVVILTVAIFPLLGIGGNELFVAEAPGIKSSKIHPKISATAKRLWLIYVGLTIVLIFLLWASGMTFFDAINHAYACMSTGGFSTKNTSIADYSGLIQYILILFMFIASVNFSLLYFGLKFKIGRIFRNDEFKTFFIVLMGFSLIFTANLYFQGTYDLEESFRASAFQVISIISTTGFVSADYTAWGPILLFLSFLLLFVGGSSGSTSGGIKMVRHFIFFSNVRNEFKKLLHPRAIIPLYMNGKIVPNSIISRVQVFLVLYIGIFFIGSLVLMAMGIDFVTSMGATITALSNVGPGIGAVGPVDNYAWMPLNAKAFLGAIMIVGRLEIFTVLILFMPYFWRKS